jgi:voltage-gated potassium channel
VTSNPQTDRISRILEALVVVAALASIPIILAQHRGDTSFWIVAGDWLIWFVFLADLFFAVSIAEDRWKAFRGQWVTVLIVVLSFPFLPDTLAWARVARLGRLVRLFRVILLANRALRAMKRSSKGQGLLYVGSVTIFLTLMGGTFMLLLEPAAVHSSLVSGMWWAVVTVTTVGYGDITPESPAGRLVAIVLMLCGLGLLSTLTASISAYFVESDEGAEIDRLNKRIASLEEKVDRLLALAERANGGKNPPK